MVSVVDLILMMDEIIDLRKQHEVRLGIRSQGCSHTLLGARLDELALLIQPHLILHTEVQVDARLETMYRAIRNECFAATFKAVLRIERPMMVNPSIHTQA